MKLKALKWLWRLAAVSSPVLVISCGLSAEEQKNQEINNLNNLLNELSVEVSQKVKNNLIFWKHYLTAADITFLKDDKEFVLPKNLSITKIEIDEHKYQNDSKRAFGKIYISDTSKAISTIKSFDFDHNYTFETMSEYSLKSSLDNLPENIYARDKTPFKLIDITILDSFDGSDVEKALEWFANYTSFDLEGIEGKVYVNKITLPKVTLKSVLATEIEFIYNKVSLSKKFYLHFDRSINQMNLDQSLEANQKTLDSLAINQIILGTHLNHLEYIQSHQITGEDFIVANQYWITNLNKIQLPENRDSKEVLVDFEVALIKDKRVKRNITYSFLVNYSQNEIDFMNLEDQYTLVVNEIPDNVDQRELQLFNSILKNSTITISNRNQTWFEGLVAFNSNLQKSVIFKYYLNDINKQQEFNAIIKDVHFNLVGVENVDWTTTNYVNKKRLRMTKEEQVFTNSSITLDHIDAAKININLVEITVYFIMVDIYIVKTKFVLNI